MNNCLPYEEQLQQQWIDLPLPDENMAWADMRRRLEEEDNRKPFAWWSRGCLLWGALLLGLLAGGWFLFKPKTNNVHNTTNQTAGLTTNKEVKDSIVETIDTLISRDTIYSAEKTIQKDTNTLGQTQITTKDVSDQKFRVKKEVAKTNTNNRKPVKEKNAVVQKQKTLNNEDPVDNVDPIQNNQQKANTTINPDSTKTNIPAIVANSADTTAVTKNNDSLKTTSGNNTKQEVKKDKKGKSDSSNSKKLNFSAGIAIHQQLPVAGQQFTPYSSQGRKASLADYVPSLYLRLEKAKKWFLQSEFRYGAPQQTKNILFRYTDVPSDTSSQPAFNIKTSFVLRKTFYHQLPITFNHFVLPGLSLGAGIQLNKFYSAVAEKEIIRRYNFNQQPDSVIGKTIEPFKKDSAYEFSKSYMQGVIESQYKWKRFSLGARYTFGLSPYLQFTLPGGTLQKEKNNSLQIFIRYELWKSKEK